MTERTADFIRADAALASAINTYRKANAECAYYGLRLICLHTKAVMPEATTLVLDWSDQGDYLTVSGVKGADDGDLDIDYETEPDPEGWSGNLAESNEDTWMPLAEPEPEERKHIMRASPTYDFVIDKVLAATAEPFVWEV